MRFRRYLAVFAIVSVLPLGQASAQRRRGSSAPAAEEDPLRAEARRHFDAGLVLMEVENWESALVEFERSFETYPTRSALFNYGMCLKALFRYVEAMEAFQRYLDRFSAEASRDEITRLEQNIEELRRLLGEVLIGVNIDGVEVSIDGRVVGTSPLADPVLVTSGRHRVEGRLDGYVTAERDITVTSGDRAIVAFEMREIERIGTLRIEASVSEAEVRVDGERVGVVPFEGQVAEGSHDIRVVAEGYAPWTQTVSVATGEERIVTVTLAEVTGTDPAWLWSMVGVAGAAGVAAIALGATVLVLDEDYRSTDFPSDGDYDLGKNLQIATDVCLGVAVAAAVTGGILAFTTRWDDEETAAGPEDGEEADLGVSLAPSSDGVGLVVVGRF